MKDVKVVAMADLIPGKAEKFAARYGIENCKFYPDHKSMLDSEKLDAVSVCTYNTQHAPCAIYALEKGVNVLLEKPMCVTTEEAVEIMQCGKEERQGALHRLPAPSGREHADDQKDRRIAAFWARSTTFRPAAAVVAASRN